MQKSIHKIQLNICNNAESCRSILMTFAWSFQGIPLLSYCTFVDPTVAVAIMNISNNKQGKNNMTLNILNSINKCTDMLTNQSHDELHLYM